MVAYGKDGLVYVGMGDGGSGGDPENRAQNPASLLGKILRLDPSRPAAKPVIVALGVRNPWRFSFDRANGDLWIGDVGQGSIEEVDHVAWPWQGHAELRLGRLRGPRVVREQGARPGSPRQAGCAVQPLARLLDHGRLRLPRHGRPVAAGRYFYGDYCSGTVWSLKLVGGVARQIRPEPFTVPNLTSFGEDGAGELYAVSGNGVLYRLAS